MQPSTTSVTQESLAGKGKPLPERFGFKINDILDVEENIILYDFMIEGGLNVIAAPPSSGKTLLAYHLAISFLQSGRNVVYVDLDNPVDVPKRRNLPQKIQEVGAEDRFVYLNSAKYMEMQNSGVVKSKQDFLRYIFVNLKGVERGTFVFIDSLQNFVRKTVDETEMGVFLNYLKLMTMSGVTVVLIHHFSRTEKHIKGDSRIIDLPDAVYVIEKIVNESGEILRVELKNEKKKYSEMADVLLVDFQGDYDFEIASNISEKEREVLVIIKTLYSKGIEKIQQKDLKSSIRKRVSIGNNNLQIILKKFVEEGILIEERDGKKLFYDLSGVETYETGL